MHDIVCVCVCMCMRLQVSTFTTLYRCVCMCVCAKPKLHSFIHSFLSILLQGDPNPKKQLPEKVSYYGTAVPPTSSKHVGSRVGSSNSKQIYHLEMMTCHRKKRSGLENCYC